MGYGPQINKKTCKKCGKCVQGCPMDVISAAKKKGDFPKVSYPDECWYCGSCYMVCPTNPPAIRLVHPLEMQLAVRRVPEP